MNSQLIWATSWQNQQNDCAPSEDSDQPGHLPRLIRVFTVRMKKHWVFSLPLSAQRGLWSDWADAQADLSLRWVHRPLCWFCHEAAHLCVLLKNAWSTVNLFIFVAINFRIFPMECQFTAINFRISLTSHIGYSRSIEFLRQNVAATISVSRISWK